MKSLCKLLYAAILLPLTIMLLPFSIKNTIAASWHPWAQPLAPSAASNPECLLWGSSRISCWYLDSTDKSVIWFASMDSNWTGPLSWFGAVDLEGKIASALSCKMQNARLMNCFGIGTDSRLYENIYSEHGPIVWWDDWVSRGGTLTFAPSCVLYGPSGIECFARGKDKALYQFSFDGLIWKTPRKLGGTLATQPYCYALNGGINCFITNAAGNVQWRRFTGTWSAWKNIGGNMSAPPECLSVSGGIRCVARGRDGIVRTSTFNGTAWTSWQSLGLSTTTVPKCLKPTPASFNIECFTVSSAGTLQRKRFNGINWDATQDLGGQVKGRPACVAPTPNRLDCIARGSTDGAIKLISYY